MSEQYEWPVLPLSAEILHLDDDMLKAVLVEIRANVRAAAQAAQPEAVSIKVLEIALDRLQYISDFFCDEAGGDDWHLKGVAIDALEEIQRVRASAPPEPMSAPTAEPVAEIGSFDEYGPCFNWFTHWTKFAVGTKFYAQQPANPRKADDVDLLLRAVFELCEATEEAPEVEPKNEHQRGFDKGRRFEAKAIRRSVGDWFQATFCGQSFMGEPVLTKPGVAHCIDGACHLCATPPSAATEPSDAEGLSSEQIEAGAKELSKCMDYPWDHMPHTGRSHMLETVKAIDAAIRATKGGKL